MEKSVGVQVPLYPRSFTTDRKVTTLQVTITPVTDVQQEAEIEVTSEELQPHFEKAYEKYRPKLELKGFRKGKVPLPMIKRLYGEAIERDSLDSIADDLYQKAMQEKDIHPVGKASLVDMDFKRGESFRFKIKYEVRPSIKLEKYKGSRSKKKSTSVTEAEVEVRSGPHSPGERQHRRCGQPSPTRNISSRPTSRNWMRPARR